ncbi:MoaD/ThiS family protein [Ideonella sp.]|uniref:MoaD/ThiS family protein n=1 Tax=Ideonella sp. TaxID=1929293 RepID=UPI00351AB3EC
MITIQLKFFASLREALGAEQALSLPAGSSIAAARAALVARGEPFAGKLAQGRAVRAALNQQLADESATLADGDELAFFPPVTGG